MSLKKFRTFQIALEFHRKCEGVKCVRYLRDQLLRASSSIALNLAEGSAKPTTKDRTKFYYIALGSVRECQAVFMILNYNERHANVLLAEKLAAHIINLVKKLPPGNVPIEIQSEYSGNNSDD